MSVNSVKSFQKKHPEIILGVELTPIEKPEFDFIEKHRTREGYIPSVMDKPYSIELAQTKEQLMDYGIRYAVGLLTGGLMFLMRKRFRWT